MINTQLEKGSILEGSQKTDADHLSESKQSSTGRRKLNGIPSSLDQNTSHARETLGLKMGSHQRSS